jgi:hypothetical protein
MSWHDIVPITNSACQRIIAYKNSEAALSTKVWATFCWWLYQVKRPNSQRYNPCHYVPKAWSVLHRPNGATDNTVLVHEKNLDLDRRNEPKPLFAAQFCGNESVIVCQKN